jgi:hypothetical protein
VKKLVRWLSVFGISATGIVASGCDDEVALQFRDAVINGAVVFVEQATIDWLTGALEDVTQP